MVMTMKNSILWDVMPCGCCLSQCFGGMYHRHLQGGKNQQARNNISSNCWLLLTDSFHPDDEAVHSFETSARTRATWQDIPEDGILHCACFFPYGWSVCKVEHMVRQQSINARL
jgi:hypothetical protein